MNVIENFVYVLNEYVEKEDISVNGEIIYRLIEEGIIDKYKDIFDKEEVKKEIYKEDILENIKNKDITDIKVIEEEKGKGLSIKINDVEYRYVSDEFNCEELKEKMENLLDVSEKDAILWLKRNAVNYYSERNKETEDMKRALREKIEEWQKRVESNNLDKDIQLIPVEEGKGLMISVFEGKDGEIHESNKVVQDIQNYVKKIDSDVDITENWEYEEDNNIGVWYTSFVIDEADSFEEAEDAEEFINKMSNKMGSVATNVSGEIFDINFVDFEVTDDDNVDIEFEGNIKDEDINEDNVEEFLEKEGFLDDLIDKVGQVVDDYEDAFLEFADLDIEIDGEKIKLVAEFKVVDEIGEEDE